MSCIANPWWASDTSVHLLHVTNRLSTGHLPPRYSLQQLRLSFPREGRISLVSDNIILSRSPCTTDKIKALPRDLPVLPKCLDK